MNVATLVIGIVHASPRDVFGREFMGLSVSAARLVRVAAVAAATLAGAATASAQTAVRFTLDWRFEGPSAPFLVALEKGYFKAEGLDVTIDAGNGSRESIPRVASGTYQVGFGDVNSLIRFRDENPTVDLKAVLMVYDRPPFAIIGRKSRGITNDVKSLEGKKFGAPAADAAYAQWPIFKAVNKLDDSHEVRERRLPGARADARLGRGRRRVRLQRFVLHQPEVARRAGPTTSSSMLMSDYGVELYGNVIMVNPAFAAEKPEAVKGFKRARQGRQATRSPIRPRPPIWSSSATTSPAKTSSSSGSRWRSTRTCSPRG
jgi:NitT/TauT family transport system substrate-binding protein